MIFCCRFTTLLACTPSVSILPPKYKYAIKGYFANNHILRARRVNSWKNKMLQPYRNVVSFLISFFFNEHFILSMKTHVLNFDCRFLKCKWSSRGKSSSQSWVQPITTSYFRFSFFFKFSKKNKNKSNPLRSTSFDNNQLFWN